MDVSQLAESEEITMRTTRQDGTWSSRPIWVVTVNNEPYVRSVYGERSDWYRRVLAGAPAEIEVNGERVPVSVERISDRNLNKKVTDAYRNKYASSDPGSTGNITEGEPLATTMRLSL